MAVHGEMNSQIVRFSLASHVTTAAASHSSSPTYHRPGGPIAMPSITCNTVLTDPRGHRWVCEATYGTEHTHADLRGYMRWLNDGELTITDEFETIRLI